MKGEGRSPDRLVMPLTCAMTLPSCTNGVLEREPIEYTEEFDDLLLALIRDKAKVANIARSHLEHSEMLQQPHWVEDEPWQSFHRGAAHSYAAHDEPVPAGDGGNGGPTRAAHRARREDAARALLRDRT